MRELFVQGLGGVCFDEPNHRPDRDSRRDRDENMDMIFVSVYFFDDQVGAVLGQPL